MSLDLLAGRFLKLPQGSYQGQFKGIEPGRKEYLLCSDRKFGKVVACSKMESRNVLKRSAITKQICRQNVEDFFPIACSRILKEKLLDLKEPELTGSKSFVSLKKKIPSFFRRHLMFKLRNGFQTKRKSWQGQDRF